MRSLHCKHRANELQVSFVWNNFRDLRMIWTIRSSSANYRVLSWKPSAIGLIICFYHWSPPRNRIVKAQFKITRLINSICQRVSWSAIDRSSWIDQIVWFERFSKFCRRNSSWSFSLWWAYYGLWKHSWIRMSSEVLNLWIISLHQTFPHRWSSGKFTWIFQGNFHLEVPTCSNRVEFCWERRSFAIVKVVYCEQCSVLGDQFEWAHCTII